MKFIDFEDDTITARHRLKRRAILARLSRARKVNLIHQLALAVCIGALIGIGGIVAVLKLFSL